MDTQLSLESILTSLEAQIAHHREQAALHAEREEIHRNRKAEHEAELDQLAQSFAAFKATAASAVELASRLPLTPPVPSAPPLAVDDLPPVSLSFNKLVARVVADRAPDQPFGPRVIGEEVNRRFAARLKKPLDLRQVSVSLRWLVTDGQIRKLETGRPHHESRYVRPAAAPE
jgi:hypothetical protein